jgi:hypothetical protein
MHLLGLCLYIWNNILFLLKNIIYQDSNEMFNYRIKFKFKKRSI